MSRTDETIDKVVTRLIEVIEAGQAGEWTKPWTTVMGGMVPATNVVTGARYRGINAMALGTEQYDKGYDNGLWGTYKQWASIEAQVQKGERATLGIKWGFTYRCEACDHKGPFACPKHGDEQASRHGWASGFLVFNASQTDHDYDVPEPGTVTEPERRADVDAWIEALGADIRERKSNRAYYTYPPGDFITLPKASQFDTIEAYYGTKLHELTHWSGASHRLDRDKGGTFGDAKYAKEELVAELGSAFASAHLGIEVDPHPEHVDYLHHWLTSLKAEPKVLYTSARDAQASLDYLITIAEGREATSNAA